jgi:hypothetical protein
VFVFIFFFLEMNNNNLAEQKPLAHDIPHSSSDSQIGHSSISTVDVTQQEDHSIHDIEKGIPLTRTTTILSLQTLKSVQKKMSDALDNYYLAAFLLIVAGICIAFQAGKFNERLKKKE